MSSYPLDAFGLRRGVDVQHKLLADQKIFEPNRFFENSLVLLNKIRPIILDEVIPKLEEYSGRWNPGGFMVFPLGLTEDSSSLRLHISPAGARRDILNGPFIHNHGWHLASLVLAGIYSDIIYSVEQIPANVVEPGDELLQIYETIRNSDGKDSLVTSGTMVIVKPTESRSIKAGNCHTIEAINTYHKPTTPSEKLAATLVLDSPAFTNTTHVLLNAIGDNKPIKRQRLSLDRESVETAKKQLMVGLGL